MYCSNCGAKENGNYCSKCGAELAAIDLHDLEIIDWSSEISYSKLLRIPEVRDLISLAAKKNNKNMSMEELLDTFGGVLKPLTGGVALDKLAAISRPISTKFGISVEKKRSEKISVPTGTTIVNLLCLFAELGQKIISVAQAEDGCVIEATIPSDIWSWEGTILVMVQQRQKGTLVETSTKIMGQMLDFGKSERFLGKLFKYIGGE